MKEKLFILTMAILMVITLISDVYQHTKDLKACELKYKGISVKNIPVDKDNCYKLLK